jgi:hypothetical protein
VAGARERVRTAGLADRIEIRLGDADLPVGARIVSQRFTFGDWEPDQTVDLVIGDGYHYLIHLWTITPEVKARAVQN